MVPAPIENAVQELIGMLLLKLEQYNGAYKIKTLTIAHLGECHRQHIQYVAEAAEEGGPLGEVDVVGEGAGEIKVNSLRVQKRAGLEQLLIVGGRLLERYLQVGPDPDSHGIGDTRPDHHFELLEVRPVLLCNSPKPLLPNFHFLGLLGGVFRLEFFDDEGLQVLAEAVSVVGNFFGLFRPHYHNNFPSMRESDATAIP